MTRKAWDHGGKTAHQRGYGKEWRKIRDAVIASEPLCRTCTEKGRQRLATQVDHVIPKAKGGTDDVSNLRPLCRPCHDDKTQEDAGRRAKPSIGLDGWPT